MIFYLRRPQSVSQCSMTPLPKSHAKRNRLRSVGGAYMVQERLSVRDATRFVEVSARFDRVTAPIVKGREQADAFAAQLGCLTTPVIQPLIAYSSFEYRMPERAEAIVRSIRPLGEVIAEAIAAAQRAGANSRARLVLTGTTPPRVIVDGSERAIPRQLLKLLIMLAEKVANPRAFVSRSEIESEFSRRAPADLVRELRAWLRGNSSRDNPILIEKVPGRALRYRLDLNAEDVRFASP